MSCLRQGISPLCGNIKYITLLILRYQIDYIIILATVITNLLSAIPFIGGDLVPLSIILSLYLLYISLKLFIKIIFNQSYICPAKGWVKKVLDNTFCIKKYIHIYLSSRLSPGLYINTISNIQHIKIISTKSHTKDRDTSFLEKDIKNIDRNLLALIVGFIDGDGYIRINKKSKDNINYIYISLIINLNKNDLKLLQYFHQQLNIGKVYNITPKKGNKLARWEINKLDLFNKIEPLLEYHNIKFLTETRQKQYLLLKYIKHNKLVYYEDIINNNNYINEFIENNLLIDNFIKLDYFNNWLVGFTMAEGSFLIKKNKDICFQLKQKYNLELFNNITLFFNTTRKLNINKNKYIQFNVSSKNDIQNIINFFSFSNNQPLLGNKLISYNKWLFTIKNSIRYKELKTPYISWHQKEQ